MNTPTELPQSFLDKIKISGQCWEWQGAKANRFGHGKLTYHQVSWLAHRFSYTVLKGTIPTGLQLDHLCANPCCVNPDHLEPVTCGENLLRSPNTLTGVNARKTHCKHGHPFDEANTLIRGSYRRCRECNRIHVRAFKASLPKKGKTNGNDQKACCKRGHEFTHENTRIKIWNGKHSRQCRICEKERQRKRATND